MIAMIPAARLPLPAAAAAATAAVLQQFSLLLRTAHASELGVGELEATADEVVAALRESVAAAQPEPATPSFLNNWLAMRTSTGAQAWHASD